MTLEKLTCIPLFVGGYLDGERKASAALLAATWPSGAAVTWTANGYVAAAPNDFCGVAMRGSTELSDQTGYVENAPQNTAAIPTNVPVAFGPNKFRMLGTLIAGATVYPFLQTPAGGVWAVGNKVYLTAAGKYDNAPVAGTDRAYGVVDAVIGPAAAATGLELSLF